MIRSEGSEQHGAAFSLTQSFPVSLLSARTDMYAVKSVAATETAAVKKNDRGLSIGRAPAVRMPITKAATGVRVEAYQHTFNLIPGLGEVEWSCSADGTHAETRRAGRLKELRMS